MWGHHKKAPPTQKQAGPHHSSLTLDLTVRSMSGKSLLLASCPFMPLCCLTSWQVSALILKSWSSFWGVGVRNQRAQFSTTVTLLASGHWLRGACTGDVNCRTTGPSHRRQCLVQRDIPSEAPGQTGHYQAQIIKRGGHGVAGPGTGRKAVWSCPYEGLLSSQNTLKIMQEGQNPF